MARMFFKAPLSFLLSLSLVAALSLSTLAALGADENEEEMIAAPLPAFQEPTGTLTRAERDVTVNGAAAKEGATVMSGSLIRTGTDSHASIEMASLGRVDYGRLTESVLTMGAGEVHASMNKCGSITLTLPAGVRGLVRVINMSDVGVLSKRDEVDVRVKRGEALVKYGQGKERTLKAGDHREFDNATEVTATGDAVFEVYCHEDHYPIPVFLPLGALAVPIVRAGGGRPPFLSTLQP